MPILSASQIVQLLLAVGAVACFVALYRRSRTWGMAFVWASWLFAPLVRRLVEYTLGVTERDVLSLVPFVVTGLAGLAAIRTAHATRPMLAVMGIAAAGLLVGVPAGLAHPLALGFALLAYGAPMTVAFIGASEARAADTLAGGDGSAARGVARPSADTPLGTLGTTLVASLPLIGAYGILQYYALGALPWDVAWIEASGMHSFLTPEAGRLRAFATLNSAFPAAAALGVALLVLLARSRIGVVAAVGGLLGSAALAVTYVRSAWVGLAIAVAVFVIGARARAVTVRVTATALVAVTILAVGFALGHPTAHALLARGASVAQYESDKSAQTRFDLIEEIGPRAIGPGTPVGHGLGQAGVASGLGGSSPLASADNGYLAILYQTGPLGLGLLLVALLAIVVVTLRRVRAREPGAALHLAVIVFVLVLEFFNDALYGMRGAMLWYVAGSSLSRAFAAHPAVLVAVPSRLRRAVPAPPARRAEGPALDKGSP